MPSIEKEIENLYAIVAKIRELEEEIVKLKTQLVEKTSKLGTTLTSGSENMAYDVLVGVHRRRKPKPSQLPLSGETAAPTTSGEPQSCEQ